MDFTSQPPESGDVNAMTLARIFDDYRNSYKFWFFLALLDCAERNFFDERIPLPIDEIVLDMLTLAWYPHVYFRLSFGVQDKISAVLDEAAPSIAKVDSALKPWDKDLVREYLARFAKPEKLARYVPYRLVRPFLPDTMGLKRDQEVNLRVVEMCEKYFVSSTPPPYKIDISTKSIVLHKAWARYFRKNFALVRGWASWHLVNYMQKCNPNVPAVPLKLFPSAERESLERQTSYWKHVLSVSDFRCIYSDERISAADFALDHFIPWSFVVHNQLWNLIPTSKTVNSKKSDRLPSVLYLPKFVNAQFDALRITRDAMAAETWRKHVDCFVADLGLPDYDSLREHVQFTRGYNAVIPPLIQLAESNGFEPSWEYRI